VTWSNGKTSRHRASARSSVGYLSILLSLACTPGAWTVDRVPVGSVSADATAAVSRGLLAVAVVLAGWGLYLLVAR
jgi:hypothetical protein